MGPVGRSGQAKAQPVDPDEMFQWLRGVLEGLCIALKVPPRRRGGLSRPGITFSEVEAGGFETGRAVSVTIEDEPAGQRLVLMTGEGVIARINASD